VETMMLNKLARREIGVSPCEPALAIFSVQVVAQDDFPVLKLALNGRFSIPDAGEFGTNHERYWHRESSRATTEIPWASRPRLRTRRVS
jgi:hypothetical protein